MAPLLVVSGLRLVSTIPALGQPMRPAPLKCACGSPGCKAPHTHASSGVAGFTGGESTLAPCRARPINVASFVKKRGRCCWFSVLNISHSCAPHSSRHSGLHHRVTGHHVHCSAASQPQPIRPFQNAKAKKGQKPCSSSITMQSSIASASGCMRISSGVGRLRCARMAAMQPFPARRNDATDLHRCASGAGPSARSQHAARRGAEVLRCTAGATAAAEAVERQEQQLAGAIPSPLASPSTVAGEVQVRRWVGVELFSTTADPDIGGWV